jgi:hypothetical protein
MNIKFYGGREDGRVLDVPVPPPPTFVFYDEPLPISPDPTVIGPKTSGPIERKISKVIYILRKTTSNELMYVLDGVEL